MCRSIKTLRQAEGLPEEEEIRAAALQFVRKISGFRKPSRVNEEAFNLAVEGVARVSTTLLEALVVPGRARS